MWDHIKFGDLSFEEQDIIEFYAKFFKSHETSKLSL